jgi:hypothetical protein
MVLITHPSQLLYHPSMPMQHATGYTSLCYALSQGFFFWGDAAVRVPLNIL